jgi:hypothetical protein
VRKRQGAGETALCRASLVILATKHCQDNEIKDGHIAGIRCQKTFHGKSEEKIGPPLVSRMIFKRILKIVYNILESLAQSFLRYG